MSALPPFDRNAIEAHVSLLHDMAAGVDGVVILAAFEECGAAQVQRFKVGDIARMTESIMGFENHPSVNLYAPWSVMRRDLEPCKKGAEGDVIAVLAAVPDLDNDKYQIGGLPVDAPYIVESSPGNFQPVYIFERPLAVADAKPVLAALSDFIGGDNGTKDCSHVWRIPGTLNIPTKSKLARGRSPVPAAVTIKKHYDGRLIDPATLLALAPGPRLPNGHDAAPSGPLSFAEEASLRGALDVIPAEDRDTWRNVGMALHSVGERALWDEWSKRSKKFDQEEQDKAWKYFHADRNGPVITIATIYHMAKNHGWVPPGQPNGEAPGAWPKPKPLPDGLLPVAAFDPAFLPEAIAPWVMDISDRMQCPPDFVGIPAMVALGSVIGRKVGLRPQRKTDWYEVPNLWGCIVGRPGAMKSPAMDEALKPLHRLEAEARKANEAAAKDYEIEIETFKLRKEDGQKKGRAALKGGAGDISSLLATDEPEEPSARRYVVNDATYEALGVILADNPNGTLAFRDELVSLLKNLDREEQVSARGFFLTAWNGTSGYTFDRIIRGKTHIEAVCLSLLGSTQPGRLAEYMRGALTGGAGDDGMVQRFSLLVWPDQNPSWENTDRYPASEPRAAAWQAFRRLDELTADAAGAATDEFAPVPYLRFDEDAQGVFNEWRQALEMRLRSDDLMPALESHLAKYRKLVPALALINHLADGGTGAISETAILRAVAFAEYLETHAKRAYAAGSEVATAAAKAILKRIRNSDLADGFTARDIYRNHWADLSDRNRPQAGLDLLNDFDWLRGEKRETGGRTSVVYRVNPRAWL